MAARPLWSQVVNDAALTRGLQDPEARLLVEWLVEQVERPPRAAGTESGCAPSRLLRRVRAVSRFVWLWCHQRSPGAALQLAASERFAWPLPTGPQDPYGLLAEILAWEARRVEAPGGRC